MRLGTVLLLIGVVTLVVYFWLFYRVFQNAGEEAKRFLETFGNLRNPSWIGAVIIIGAFLVPNPIATIVLGAMASY